MFLGVTDNDLLHIKDHLSYNFEYSFENIFEFFKWIIHHRSLLISSTVHLFLDDSVMKNYKIVMKVTGNQSKFISRFVNRILAYRLTYFKQNSITF